MVCSDMFYCFTLPQNNCQHILLITDQNLVYFCSRLHIWKTCWPIKTTLVHYIQVKQQVSYINITVNSFKIIISIFMISRIHKFVDPYIQCIYIFTSLYIYIYIYIYRSLEECATITISVSLHNLLDFYNLFCLCCIVMSRRSVTH